MLRSAYVYHKNRDAIHLVLCKYARTNGADKERSVRFFCNACVEYTNFTSILFVIFITILSFNFPKTLEKGEPKHQNGNISTYLFTCATFGAKRMYIRNKKNYELPQNSCLIIN